MEPARDSCWHDRKVKSDDVETTDLGQVNLRTNESFDLRVRTEDWNSTEVDGRTHSKPTPVLAPASVINASDHHPSVAEAQEFEVEVKDYETETGRKETETKVGNEALSQSESTGSDAGLLRVRE